MPVSPFNKSKPPQTAAQVVNPSTKSPSWGILGILVLTALLYSGAVSNGFTNFDDDFYIINNPFLRDFSFDGVKAIFTSFYTANYHPLTTLVFWFEYHFAGLEPLTYHLVNVVLHIINTWMVYKVVQQLSDKKFTALIVALFFGIHPMHVESVAWISELKDVLYTLFYLISLYYYLNYSKTSAKKNLYIALVFFLLSLLSKSAAVTLPVLLLAIDVYKGRKINTSSIIEKLPFFLLALVFGIVAIMSQKEGGALRHLSETHTVIERLFFFTYGLSSYLVRLVAPLHLSAMHNYPVSHNGALPWICYASLPFVILMGWAIIKFRAYRKELFFGLAFFLITISVMLQVIAVGSALTAERYTYVPYIGLFYIAGQCASDLLDTRWRNVTIGVFATFGIVFCILTRERITVWKDGNVLFTDVIQKNPDYYFGYWMRANLRIGEGNKEAAIQDYTQAITLNPTFEDLYYDRAHAYFETGNAQAAIRDYSDIIAINPNMAEAFNDRGWAYYKTGNKDAALMDINKSIGLNPQLAEAYNNRGLIYYEAGNIEAALPDYSKAIIIKPDYLLPYFNRAALKANNKDFKGAIDDYNAVIGIDPGNNNAFYNRGLVKYNLNDKQAACLDWQKAQELGNEAATELINRFCR